MKKKNRCADEFPSSSIRKYIGYPDSAYIHFDEVGAVLFIFRANPSLKELDGFEKFEIRITEFSKIMFISFRFGSSDWCSISYSPYLDTWQSKQFIFPNCKYGINLFIALFDTSTGKILRARMLDLPCLFSKKIRSAIVLQALQPFNKEKYIKVIKQFTFFSFARRNCSAKQIIITLHSPLSCITDCPYTKIMNYFHTTHFKIIRKMQNHYSVFHKKLKVR